VVNVGRETDMTGNQQGHDNINSCSVSDSISESIVLCARTRFSNSRTVLSQECQFITSECGRLSALFRSPLRFVLALTTGASFRRKQS